MCSHYPDLHGMIITQTHKRFEDFIYEYDLNPLKYKLMRSEQDTRGYHVDSYPNTIVLCLSELDVEWIDPHIMRFLREFHLAGLGISLFDQGLVPIIVEVLRISGIKYLPKYLTHDEERVREAAQRRYNELIGTLKMQGNETTNCNLRLEDH